jgi:hypothetical protein
MELKYAMPSRNGHCVFPRTEDLGSNTANVAEFLHYLHFNILLLLKIWDRCYDILNIFAENFSKQIGVFDSKTKPKYEKF